MDRPALSRRATTELIAAFALVFAVGSAAAEAGSGRAELGLAAMAAVSGLVIAALVYAIGHLSGAHINPAVTIAFAITRHFPPRDAVAYIAAQLTGSGLAGLLLHACWPQNPGRLGANAITVSPGLAVLYELLLTALLMFVIVAVATDTRAVGSGAAIAIGTVVTVDILMAGAISGASMNPARSFGPALGSGTWADFWVWVLGPILGALAGALAYQYVRVPNPPPGATP
jgi:MIP family channel proteins